MEQVKKSQIGGISIVCFIVVVVASLSYYQFLFLPAYNAKPVVAGIILHPPQTTKVTIDPGSSQESQTHNFEPKQLTAALGVSNKFVWTNTDSVPHSVTSDSNYVDPINGKFDSISTIGLIPPKGTYTFTFTQPGEYSYHCTPHPWMKGKITVTKSFS
ncbi:MAG TPA: plastocyanin/azurin family copper-binding protein [Candidatus Sulfopaludibacter sp.]|nr:plastocyanin/azurin family copper-binding protein [Candidatus Sulfopaludibacter sp.]